MSDAPDSGVTLSPAQFAEAFPFHIVFDSGFRVLSAGRSIGRVHPGLAPGVIVTDVFELVALAGATPEQLAEVRDRPILIRSSHSRTHLRGQVFRTGPSFVFVGSPWPAAGDSLDRLGLSFRDFAVHDPTPDLVDLVQAHATAVDEMRDLASKVDQSARVLQTQYEASRILEEQLRAVVNTAIDGIVSVNPRGEVGMYNPAAEAILGWPAAEIVGRSVSMLLARDRPVRPSAIERFLRGRFADRVVSRQETFARHKDGRVVPVELSVSMTQQGPERHFVGIVRDISRRHAADRELREARSRLESLITNMEWGVLVEDETRHIVIVNERFTQLFGIPAPPEALIGADCSNAAEDVKGLFEDPEGFVRRIGWILAERKKVLADLLELKDGRVFVRDYVPIFVEEEYRGHLWQYRDITDRYRAAAALAESEARLRAILETSLDAIVTIDEHGNLVEFNPSAERIFGWRRQDAIGRSMAELIVPPQHRDAHRAGMERHLRTGTSTVLGRRLELTALRSDGSEFPVELAITRIDTGGRPLFSGHIRDITERVEAQRQLLVARDAAEAASRAKSDFLAAISHELRTPLHIITGTTELLYGSSLEEGHRESLETIRGQSETLLYLIDQILDLGKIEAGRIVLDETEVDLRLLVETLTDSLQIHARGRGITLQSFVGPRVPGLVRMDGFRFQQILTNLVTNAIKFTPMGQVDLHLDVAALTPAKASVTLRVVDTGVGVPPDRFGDIFQPFVQLDPTSTRKVGGAGLGLSITRYLVEAMGGRIWVESELGKGSTFHVELDVPVADLEPRTSGTGPLRLATVPSAESVGRILVVDDHELGRRLTRRLLETAGHQVVEAASASEAIEILASTRFDLVFMDVEMPVMNGLDATRLIRESEAANESKRTPIIGLSAHAIDEVRARGLEAGMDGYVTKPIKRADLLACVEEWISSREPGSERTSSNDRIDVTVDPEIADLVPEYLNHVRSVAQSIDQLAARGEWREIRVIGHNLKGSGAPHGLWEISRLGGDIQRAIDAGETGVVVALAHQLVDYVSKVRIS